MLQRRRARGLGVGRLLVAAVLVAAGSAPGGTGIVRAGEPDAAAGARHLASLNGGVPGDFELVHERTSIATDGASVWAGKLVDRRSGEVHVVYLAAGGITADAGYLAAASREANAAKGPLAAKADAALLSVLGEGRPTATLPVAIWLDADVDAAEATVRARQAQHTWVAGRPLVNDLDTIRALRGELWEARRAEYARAADAIRPRVAAAGGTIAYVSTSAPLVFVDLPPAAIEGLAARPEILSLGLERGWKEQMSSAGPTVGANWTSGNGDRGNGARVAVVEYQNVRNSGDLAGRVARSYSTTGTLSYGSGAGDHPTWVAGAVASQHGTFTGVAPGASIISASTGGYSPSLATDRAIIAAADWAIAPAGGNADIVNASIGQDTAAGAEEARRYFDSIVWEAGRLVVASSGNYVTFGNWDVVSPGTGYNVMTVGGINDRGTAGTADDRLWYVPGSNGAAYRDRTDAPWNQHGDYNKPNVSAPAVSVRTANGMIGDGTSISSPIVAGIAAQLIARAPVLAAWPEGTRALIMAGAWRRTPLPNGGLSPDHEGVGTASALWSNRILTEGGGPFGGYVVGSMQRGQTIIREVPVIAGQTVRAAIAWSSHTSGASNTGKSNTLTADLDLRVIAPNGASAGSYTFDNSYEAVDITSATSGTLRIEVRQTRFDADEEPYGLAWVVRGPFTDADESPFRSDILWAAQEGITAGCAPGRFCPSDAVTREQMASFIRRAGRLPASSVDYFTDDSSSAHQGDINAIAAAGITGGCATNRFCPTSPVTRAQMASFLVRALKLPPSTVNAFTDDDGSIHEGAINALAAARITGGCAANRFCPSATVTRAQMAAFLHRGYGR
jgi:hypothetical protein